MYMFFGMLCFILIVLFVLKIFFNRKKGSKVSRLLAQYHLPMFAIMMAAMIIHAVAAGYRGVATISGLVCIAVSAILAASYFIMKRRNMAWKNAHRVFAVLLLAVTLVHIALA